MIPRQYAWKRVRFESKVLRVFAEIESGELAVAMTDERYAFHVQQGGERRPHDCPAGVRWLDLSQPMLAFSSDTTFVPIRAETTVLIPGAYLGLGVLIPTIEAFAFAEQFGFQIQAPGATRRGYFRVERSDPKDRTCYHTVFRGEHHLALVRRRNGDPRGFVYLEADIVSAEENEHAAVALASALEDRHSEVRRLWRRSQRSKATDVPALMRLIGELREQTRAVVVGAA